MTKDERELLQDILVDYIENPRKMGTCIKNIESLFRTVHRRWVDSSIDTECTVQITAHPTTATNDNAQDIINRVCERYDITYSDLTGKGRTKHLITAREQICQAMYRVGFNFSQIGRAINRHPSTIIHTINKGSEE